MTGRSLNLYLLDAAERVPDAVAFRFKDQQITYAELAVQAGRVATVLNGHGVTKGTPVGVCMERCLETSVAIYGILAAGGVFVPLDPAAPAKRHADIMTQTQMRHLIIHEQTLQVSEAVLAEYPDLDFVLGGTDLPWSSVTTAPAAATLSLSSDDLAYCIFTSGSTGAPKGVMHTHASADAYAEMAAALYGVSNRSVIANHAPTHFDVSTFGLYSGPAKGAQTVFLSKAQCMLPSAQAQLLQSARITHWYSIATAMHQLFTLGGLEALDLSAMEWIVFCGEAYSNAQLCDVLERHPDIHFSQSYGPAEVNQCTYHHFDQLPPPDANHPPIGIPTPGSECLVVDLNDAPLGAGEVGELLVAAPTMMRGYLANDALNASSFATLPSATGVLTQYYRTGDLMTQCDDGLLMFRGRKDRMIKFRGVRVELDEIEAILTSHPAVESAAAFLNAPTTAILGAVTLLQGYATNGDDLRAYLAERLPQNAVPETVHVMGGFPQTGSGKTDRNALRSILEQGDTEEFDHDRSN